MQYALFGDVHGNYDALKAVLSELDKIEPDAVFCLGDLVGYGAEPCECIEAIRERKIACVVGNHDLAAADALSMDYFNDMARASVLWTRGKLSDEDLRYLTALPFQLECEMFTLVHGSVEDPASFDYILTLEDAAFSFEALEHEYAFTAHTHVPVTFVRNGREVTATVAETLLLPEESRALVNVGSVGQPRDRNPLAAFALFDSDEGRLSIRRVRYDVEAAVRKIVEAGLPPVNGYRLLLGQ